VGKTVRRDEMGTREVVAREEFGGDEGAKVALSARIAGTARMDEGRLMGISAGMGELDKLDKGVTGETAKMDEAGLMGIWAGMGEYRRRNEGVKIAVVAREDFGADAV
jgi:hypothetical protein